MLTLTLRLVLKRTYQRLKHNNQNTKPSLLKVTGVITDIRTAVVNGNSIYYIAVDNNPVYYSISTAEDDNVVILNVGDTVNISYVASDEAIVTAKAIGK